MLNIRPATPADVPEILAFIHELAEYEKQPDAVKATEADLLRDGFGPQKVFSCLIAEWIEGGVVHPAAMALYIPFYSTWRGNAGIHLEDAHAGEFAVLADAAHVDGDAALAVGVGAALLEPRAEIGRAHV